MINSADIRKYDSIKSKCGTKCLVLFRLNSFCLYSLYNGISTILINAKAIVAEEK